MEPSDEDIDNYRMKHESDKEWHLRRAFLVAHREKFSDSRLCCLSSCYINVECYGCRYPPALMRQLAELTAELPNQSRPGSNRHGLPQSVKFVPSGSADMEPSDEDIDNYRMQHESDKEWCMRRAFLVAHREKFSDSRLCCLASCYINVECYGCRYPPALMRQLAELTAELPNQSSLGACRRGLPQTIKFVPAGQSGNKSVSEVSSKSAAEPSVSGRVSLQSCVSQGSDNSSLFPAKLSKLEASFHCLADKLKGVYRSKSLTESKSVPELVQIAIDKARMSATTQFTKLGPGKGFRCDLSIDFVLVSSGEAQNKRLAKHSAYVAAAELLRQPHLCVSEDTKQGVTNRRLVAANDPTVKPLPQQRIASSINTTTHLPSRQSATSRPMDKDPECSTNRNSAETGNKRSSSLLRGASLKDFVILQPSTTDTNAVNILRQSADFNKWPLEYDVSEMGSRFRCRVTLAGHELSDVVADSKSAVKTVAAEQAVKRLASTSCTVCIKKLGDEELEDTLKRNEVVGGKEKDSRIPDSNVGNQLLKKMGWTGGGVGKDDNRGIEEPVSLVAVVNRAGLGSMQLNDFAPSVKRVIADFISSGGHDDLVFSPEFTSEERAVIHAEARKRHLKTRSYGSGDQRHLILSLQRTPLQLVEHLRAHGGETVKYSLIEPNDTSSRMSFTS